MRVGFETDAESVAVEDESVTILLTRGSKSKVLMVQTVVAATGSVDSPPAELREHVVEVCSFGVVTESSLSDEG